MKRCQQGGVSKEGLVRRLRQGGGVNNKEVFGKKEALVYRRRQ